MKILYILVASFILSFCSKDNQKHSQLISKLSVESLEYPSMYGGMLFFINCDSINQKKEILYNEIRLTYIENFIEDKNYNDFLRQTLKNEISFYTQDCFTLDESISETYKKLKFDDFLLFYCNLEGNVCFLKKDLNTSQISTVLYYLFINEYYAFFDDYLGIYKII